MDREIKIGFLIPTLEGGGAERILSQLINNLPNKYIKHLILFNQKICYPIDSKVKIIDLARPSTNNILKKITNFIIRPIKLRNRIKKYKLTVLLSFLENANFVNLLTWIPHSVKRIVSVRVSISRKHQYYSLVERLLIKKLYNRADTIICPSEGIGKELIKQYSIKKEKINVINNPCDIGQIQEKMNHSLSRLHKIILNQSIIITVGRLQKQKGHWHLIRAMKKVNSIYPEAQLVIIGEGCLHNYYLKLIKEMNLEDRIFLVGFKKNPFKFIKASDVFVLPSIFEGFPNVLIEAMACGIPVIATDCETGPKEIISPEHINDVSTRKILYGKYGILTPPLENTFYNSSTPLTFAENCLADTIIEILKNEPQKKKYSAKSKERAEHYNIDRILSQFDKIFSDEQRN